MYKASTFHVYQGQRHRNSHADAENTGTCIVGGEKIMDEKKGCEYIEADYIFFCDQFILFTRLKDVYMGWWD